MSLRHLQHITTWVVLVGLVSCSKTNVNPDEQNASPWVSHFVFEPDNLPEANYSISQLDRHPLISPVVRWGAVEPELPDGDVHAYKAPETLQDHLEVYDTRTSGLLLRVSAENQWGLLREGSLIKGIKGAHQIDFYSFLVFMLHAVPADYIQLEWDDLGSWNSPRNYFIALDMVREAAHAVDPRIKIVLPIYQLEAHFQNDTNEIIGFLQALEAGQDVLVISEDFASQVSKLEAMPRHGVWVRTRVQHKSVQDLTRQTARLFANGYDKVVFSGHMGNFNALMGLGETLRSFRSAHEMAPGIVQFQFDDQLPVYIIWQEGVFGKVAFDAAGEVSLFKPDHAYSEEGSSAAFTLQRDPQTITQLMINAKLRK